MQTTVKFWGGGSLQGYLVHKKTPAPTTLQWGQGYLGHRKETPPRTLL